MNSKLDLALLFRQLTTVHMNIDPTLVGEDVKNIEPLMIRNITLWLVPVSNINHTLPYKLFNLVQLMELNEAHIQLDAIKEVGAPDIDIPSLGNDQLGAVLINSLCDYMLIKITESEYPPAKEKLLEKYAAHINRLLLLICDSFGGMAVVIRAQLILCAWKVVKKTHPIIEAKTEGETPADIIRLLSDVLTEMPLQEDVPAMITEVGEALIQRLGMAEKV